ncbi:MAG: c-type cytochrome [Steroidobacteraceae bacterium]
MSIPLRCGRDPAQTWRGRLRRQAPPTVAVAFLPLGLMWAVAAAQVSPSTAAVTADAQYGKFLYLRHCAACHGPRAWGDGPREIPALAGQRESYLIEQLPRFADGERAGSPMHGPAMRDTLKAADVNLAPAIRDLAAYLARAPQVPRADQGEGRDLAAGRSAYLSFCAGCHGQDGAGPDGGAVPRIGGQHFRYVLSRLREFAAAHRGQAEPPALSAQQQQALADFISRLPAGRSTP